ncbi:hypothetical protein QTO30_01375 [Yoonia sp. GPGPB17]|uniref:hypothetical protein n=1 Tax=Yoonia sp. GPGPB17 TaxID=3026147 RepID=UPI0030BD0742
MAETDDGYEMFVLEWTEFKIQVAYQRNWFNTGNWHIQLQCDEPLPVTSTGYRSIFIADDQLIDEADVKEMVLNMLNEAATSKDWQRHLDDRRQLKLF